MKVFVYTKSESKKIATITDVVSIEQNGNQIVFTSKDDVKFSFDTKKIKTTSYQN